MYKYIFICMYIYIYEKIYIFTCMCIYIFPTSKEHFTLLEIQQ